MRTSCRHDVLVGPKTGIDREKFDFPAADFRSVFVLAMSSAGRTANVLEVPQSRDGRSGRAQAELGEPIFYRLARRARGNKKSNRSFYPDHLIGKTRIVKLLVVSRRPHAARLVLTLP